MCPGFFEPFLSTDTIGIPTDSTDGYAFNVAINLQILNYLQIINALDRETTDNALLYMKDGEYKVVSGKLAIPYCL